MAGRHGGYRGPREPPALPEKWRGQSWAAERRKTARAQVAKSAAVAVTLAAISAGSLSILESEAVCPAAVAIYRRYANQVLDYCLAEGHRWLDLQGLDQTWVMYFTAPFAEDGRPGKTGLMDEAAILDKNDWLLLPLLALVSGLGPMDRL